MDDFLFSFVATLLTVSSVIVLLRITRINWRSIEAMILYLYCFSMSVLLSMAFMAVVDATWFILFHTSFLSHLRDGDLIEHLEAGWK